MNGSNKDKFKMTKEQKQAFHELQEITKEDRSQKIKKWKEIIIMATIFIVIYKIIFGTINIYWPFKNDYNRWYTVTIDNVPVTTETMEETTIPLLPFFINFKMYNHETFYANRDYEIEHKINLKETPDLKISLKSSECYIMNGDNKNRIVCSSSRPNIIKEEKEIEIDNIYIRKTDKKTRKEKDIYNGPMISDLKNKLEENSEYYIRINAHYNFTKSTVIIFLDTGTPNYIQDENVQNEENREK